MKVIRQSLLILLLVGTGTPAWRAQDFSDPADILRNQAASKPVEGDGTIRSATTGKPGWYNVTMDGVNGKRFTVLLTPATKFWERYQALDTTKAYTKILVGQKVRFMHKPAFDEALHRLWACDIMFVSDWKETAGSVPSAPPADQGKPAEDPLKALQGLQNLVPGRGTDLGTGTGKPPASFESGWYYLQSQASHLNLDVAHANRDNGGHVCQAKPNKAQVWRFLPAGDGYDYIQSNVSGLNLDVVGRNKKEGGDLCQAKPDPVQVWRLIPAENDCYYIQSKTSGLFLAVDHGNKDVGGRVCQTKKDAAQPWKLIAESNPEQAAR